MRTLVRSRRRRTNNGCLRKKEKQKHEQIREELEWKRCTENRDRLLRKEKERDSKRREEERKEQKPEWVSVEMVEAVQRALRGAHKWGGGVGCGGKQAICSAVTEKAK